LTAVIIRTKSNEANDEIVIMSEEDAKNLVTFTEMMLRFIYDLPTRVPKVPVEPRSP
jgi:hypothetical protein